MVSLAMNQEVYSEADCLHMKRAIDLSRLPVPAPHPNPRVGCVVTQEGKVVGEGYHQRAGEPHAEVNALRSIASNIKPSEMYVTLEPCTISGRTPPCVDTVVASGVKRVIVSCADPNPHVNGYGIEKLRDSGVKVDVGLFSDLARDTNQGYFSRHEAGRPWITVKVAASLDGRVAMSSGESQWITGAASRSDVQRLRAGCDAILTGSGTVVADNPRLTCRLDDVEHYPTRIVVDSRLSISEDALLLQTKGELIIATTQKASIDKKRMLEKKAVVLDFPIVSGGVDCAALMNSLAEREINHVLVEAGPKLLGSLIRDKLVDEFVFYVSPSLLGDCAIGMVSIQGIEKLEQRVHLKITQAEMIGSDLRIVARMIQE